MRTFENLITIVGLLTVGYISYTTGKQIGVVNYQHSRHMQMALDSAYQYGVSDCEHGRAHKRIK